MYKCGLFLFFICDRLYLRSSTPDSKGNKEVLIQNEGTPLQTAVISLGNLSILTSCFALSSAWPLVSSRLLSTGGMSVLSRCQTHAALLQGSAAIKKLDFFFIAAELSWGFGGELNIHTLPLSRGPNRRRLQQKSVWHHCFTGEIWVPIGEVSGRQKLVSTRQNYFIPLTYIFLSPLW